MTATVTGLEAEHLYHYRFEATNSAGENLGGERVFEAKAVLDLETKPAPPEEIEKNQVTPRRAAEPRQPGHRVLVRIRPRQDLRARKRRNCRSPATASSRPRRCSNTSRRGRPTTTGSSPATPSTAPPAARTWSFRTASPPEITGVGSENVQETSADIHLNVNPVGFDTTYVVEYGTSSRVREHDSRLG